MSLNNIGGHLRDAFNRFAGFKNPDGSETVLLGSTRSGSVDATPVEVRQAHNRELRMLGSRANRHNTTFELKYSGVFNTTTDDLQTRQLVIKLPDLTGVYAIAIRIHNTRVGAITYNGLIRTFDDIGDGVYNSVALDDGAADSWQTVMLSGSADISAPAKTTVTAWPQVAAATTFDVLGTVLSSPMMLVSGLGTYLAIRTYAADNGSYSAISDLTFTGGPTGTLLTHGITAARQYGANGVAVLADFDDETYSSNMPPVSIVCYTDQEVYSICYTGGSTASGADDDITEAPADGAGIGFHNRMLFESFSDGGLRVVSANNCHPTGSTASFLAQLTAIVAGDNDYNEIAFRLRARTDDEDDLDYAAGLAGGTLAAFQPYISRVKAQALIAIRLCARYGKTCRLIIDHYHDDMDGAEYEMARVVTAWGREMAAKGYCKLNDTVARYNDETVTSIGTLKYPEYFSNGTGPHMNGYGHANEATEYITAVREGR